MKVISTATTIGQAFKNAGRVTEIMGVLAKHGFADLVHRMKLTRFLTAKVKENEIYQELPVEDRLRRSFEELGPTFVKLGQLLATRPDLLPESFTDEFQKLQDHVAPVSFEEIRGFLSAELRRPPEELFAELDPIPLAAASIGQVHKARLKSGELVAVKIQRPGIERIIYNDISILRGLALLLERYIPESRPFNPVGLVEEFFRTILWELDYRVEANNIRKIKANLSVFPEVVIPKVYGELSTERILTQELFEGVRFSDREAVLAKGISPAHLVEVGSHAFFHMVMHDGVFHGDLHAGNLFILNDGKIGIIDFGIVGRLSRRVQDSIITMFLSLMDQDFETLAAEYVAMCPAGGTSDGTSVPVDINLLQKDLLDTISPYIGMSLGEVNVGKILLRSTSIAARHRLQVPRELMLLFKAMVTIEALGKRLEPDFDLMQVGEKLARQVITLRYSPERLTRDLVVVGRDVQELIQTGPRVLRRAMRVWTQNNFAIETRSKETEAVAVALRGIGYAMLMSTVSFGLFLFGTTELVLGKGPSLFHFPVSTIISFVAGIVLPLRAAGLLRKRKK